MRERYEKQWKIFLMCNKCWEFKEADNSNFHKAKGNQFWCSSYCKVCSKKYNSKRYIEKKDEILNRTNSYYHSHKDFYSNYYENHKEKIKAKVKKWKEDNSERVKIYRLENRERLNNNAIYDETIHSRRKERERNYRDLNRDKINEKRRDRYHKTWHSKVYKTTDKVIKELWIRPSICPICWAERKIEAHHPDYNKPYEVVFCCNVCHQRIHHWWFECPNPIDLKSIQS